MLSCHFWKLRADDTKRCGPVRASCLRLCSPPTQNKRLAAQYSVAQEAFLGVPQPAVQSRWQPDWVGQLALIWLALTLPDYLM